MSFTVADLKRELEGYDDNLQLSFDGGLTFGRLKQWGDNEVIVLFAEAQAYLDPEFKKMNPRLKVGFMVNDLA
jgi:hypothetical protein